MQEITRYNRLIEVVRCSITNLKRALAGHSIISEAEEQVLESFNKNEVPRAWE
jgi:dynein heavy chain